MMTKALYRKWRPMDWDQVAAQDHVIQTLRNAVIHDRVAHAYLFAGPRGTGKTTSARLLAKAINCLEPDLKKRPCNQCEHCLAVNTGRFMDLIEIDAASNTSVDDVRDLRDKINFSPSQGKFKVYIIDEVHMLSTAAFNALLKTLEEPPPHAIFILATTEIHKIPATVLSRCQRHEFRRIPNDIIVAHLEEKSAEEDLHVDKAVFLEIARQATGSLRDAISLLDQLTSTSEHITLKIAQNVLGTATNHSVIEIVESMITENAAKGLTEINTALDKGTDSRQLARQVVTYLRNVLLYKMNNENLIEVPEEIRVTLDAHARRLTMPALLRAIEAFNQAANDEQANWHPGLGLELAFTTYLTQPEPPTVQSHSTSEPNDKKAEIKTQEAVKTKTDAQPSPSKPAQSAPKKTGSNNKISQPAAPKTEKHSEPPEQAEQEEASVRLTGEITLNDIHHAWDKILSKIRNHNARTQGILNSASLTGLNENTLILGFSSDTVKGFMEKEGNITLTEDILEEVLGQAVQVKCIVTTQKGNPVPDNLEIDKDGMVSTATRDLGGKISSAEETE